MLFFFVVSPNYVIWVARVAHFLSELDLFHVVLAATWTSFICWYQWYVFSTAKTRTMDERLLNDLLECSVCLERLDTLSKVLPCQHTFCKKCLEEIVHTHKELRCPECRVLVEVGIDELPPNVLLMRILEGMRNIPHRSTVMRSYQHEGATHSAEPSVSSSHSRFRGKSATRQVYS